MAKWESNWTSISTNPAKRGTVGKEGKGEKVTNNMGDPILLSYTTILLSIVYQYSCIVSLDLGQLFTHFHHATLTTPFVIYYLSYVVYFGYLPIHYLFHVNDIDFLGFLPVVGTLVHNHIAIDDFSCAHQTMFQWKCILFSLDLHAKIAIWA